MTTRTTLRIAPLAPALALALACGASARPGFDGADAGPGSGDGSASSSGFVGPGACAPDPGKFEIPDNGCDDDGDGLVDVPATCDDGLAEYGDADAFAKAIGLCRRATGPGDPAWGVVAAAYTRGHASAAAPAEGQHGILSAFGDLLRPREGARLGALGTGWARPFNDVAATRCDPATGTHCFKQGVVMQAGTPELGGAPPGYPKAADGCATSDQVFDPVSVKLSIKVPTNARGLRLDFDFLSGEWPDHVCTRFNDGFLVWLRSSAFQGGTPGNVAFDAAGNPPSVNTGFFDRCTPAVQTGCRGEPPVFRTSTCAGGTAELEGTGFLAPGLYCNEQPSAGGGATGWLTSQAPVTPGEVLDLELVLWDTGDPKFDSVVLVDALRWITEESGASTVRVR